MNCRKVVIQILRSALLLTLFSVPAKAQIDSLQLDSTVLSAERRRVLLEIAPSGVTRVELSKLASLPSILGNSDPLHFAQMLPSMQTSSEIDAGIHIQGCDHQHNLVALDGVPVYGASHLMGIFSAFNPTHFRSMSYATTASPGVNRLGGVIDMHTSASIPERVGADASLGLVSAQGTVTAPLGRKSALTASIRKSLVDFLYGNYMSIDGISMSYDFADANLTWIWQPSAVDRVSANFYYGYDAAGTSVSSSGTYTETVMNVMAGNNPSEGNSIDLFWRNMLGSLRWVHGDFDQTLFYTRYRLDLNLADAGRNAYLPSSIGTLGYRAGWSKGLLSLKLESQMHDVMPQNPVLTGASVEYEGEPVMKAFENSLTAGWSGTLGYDFEYEATLSGQWYVSDEKKSYFGLSPRFSGTYRLPDASRLSLRGGVYRQYLCQTGLSNLGLPLEFWLPAGKYGDPQWSVGASLSWDRTFLDGALDFNSELYCRYLANQVEYEGGFMDIIGGTYSLEKTLRHGSGHAYGLNLMVRKSQGRLTGWAAVSAGRSLRTFDGQTWPSNHERLLEMDLVAAYSAGRWDLGVTFVLAGGTPFTGVEEFYLVSHQIVSVLEPRNSSRLSPYFRLDLSAKYNFRDMGRVSHGLTFSVYNATARKQEIYRHIAVNREDGTFSYAPMYLGITVLPSVGYFMKF